MFRALQLLFLSFFRLYPRLKEDGEGLFLWCGQREGSGEGGLGAGRSPFVAIGLLLGVGDR